MTSLWLDMVKNGQLSALDAETLQQRTDRGESPAVQTESDVLQWLAAEYDMPYSDLEQVELDPELLSRFPTRLPTTARTATARSGTTCFLWWSGRTGAARS